MNRPLARLLLRSYPPAWRAQYGQELEDLLCRCPTRIFDIPDIIWSGFLERMRQPVSRLSLYALAGTAATYAISLVFAKPLWRVLATPVSDVLREQGIRPSAMIATKPLEQMEVVWVGVPALVTALIAFMLILILIWKFFSDAKEPEIRRWAGRFVCLSGAVFSLCAVFSTLAWQNGSIAKLLELYPDARSAPLLSVGHCFLLLSLSTLCATLLPQIPLIAFFAWRFRAMRHVERSART